MQCIQAALKPYCGDSCGFVLTAESIMPNFFFNFFFFIKRHISSHYIISEITLMCWGKNTPGILCAVCSFTQCIFFFICCPLVPGSDITDISVRPHTFTAGPPQLELYWPLWQFPCRLPTEVSGEIGWASVTTDKPSSLCGHDGKDQGNSVGRQADAFPPLFVPRRRSHLSRNFTPYWQCGFSQLPLQHSSTGAHPSISSLFPSLSLPAFPNPLSSAF